jgi:hypothetical protein
MSGLVSPDRIANRFAINVVNPGAKHDCTFNFYNFDMKICEYIAHLGNEAKFELSQAYYIISIAK